MHFLQVPDISDHTPYQMKEIVLLSEFLLRYIFCQDHRYNLILISCTNMSLLFLSIFSNRPSGALGVLTITMYGSDFAIYRSDTCLTSSCSDFRKKSDSSINMNLGLSNALYESK